MNCLRSVMRNIRQDDRVIIIDNGSDEQTHRFLESFSAGYSGVRMETVRLPVNVGYLRAANEGLRRSTKDVACLLSNDTVVTKGWIERMCSLMDRYPAIGIVNPMSTTFGLYPARGENAEDCAAKIAHLRGQYTEASSCVGFCMAIRRKVIESIGYLDEVYDSGYFEDTDFCRRAVDPVLSAPSPVTRMYGTPSTRRSAQRSGKNFLTGTAPYSNGAGAGRAGAFMWLQARAVTAAG